MCTTIVIERKYVVKAIKLFTERYPIIASHKPAMKFGAKWVREGRVELNDAGCFTIRPSKGQVIVIAHKVCECGIGNPCAHRIAINLAMTALEIRAADSEYQVEHAEVQEELAEQPFETESAETQSVLREAEAIL